MRIVSGKYRSRIINAPNNDKTRPTADKTRQGIFNSIQFYIVDKIVLDLFAGSGAYGIESLSRNAKFVTFIDNDAIAINTIKDNLKNLKINDYYEIIQDDYHILNNINKKFDIIFLDPPYKLDVFNEILDIIEKKSILNDGGFIVYECDKKIEFDNSNYLIKNYKYGIAYVYIFYKKTY